MLDVDFDYPLTIYITRPECKGENLVRPLTVNGFVESFDDNEEISQDDGKKNIEEIICNQCLHFENVLDIPFSSLSQEEQNKFLEKYSKRTAQNLLESLMRKIYEKEINPKPYEKDLEEKVIKYVNSAVVFKIKVFKNCTSNYYDYNYDSNVSSYYWKTDYSNFNNNYYSYYPTNTSSNLIEAFHFRPEEGFIFDFKEAEECK